MPMLAPGPLVSFDVKLMLHTAVVTVAAAGNEAVVIALAIAGSNNRRKPANPRGA